jgi:hypothetical protein
MKGQWERYAVLNLGLVIPESFVRAKVESKRKLRDQWHADFYALSTLDINRATLSLHRARQGDCELIALAWTRPVSIIAQT